ncbi:hypothetical protein [Smaragdicoccus niigatensis]|nr:hypothetical protein [Smaragdicoccus niigatensis]MCE5292113.1 hypothetical protein [Nocardiaceae bacterium]
MSDKSPRGSKSLGSGKSIKEKRAEKRDAKKPSAPEDVVTKLSKKK